MKGILSILSRLLLWVRRINLALPRRLCFLPFTTLLLTAAMLFVAPQCARAGAICTWLYGLADYCDATLVQNSDGLLVGTTVGMDEIRLESYGKLFVASTNTLPPTSFGGLTNIGAFTSDYGGEPNAGAIIGPNDSYIGTTAFYGISNTLFPTGMGSIYCYFINTNPRITNAFMPHFYRFGSVLNSHDQPLDGASPRSTLALGADSFLYGTTYEGGSNGYASNGLGFGTVFKLSTNLSEVGSNLTLTSLYSFSGADGANPTGLTFGLDGNLYGVTSFGGSNSAVVGTNGQTGFGTIFKITTNGVLDVLYSFGTLTNSAGNALDGSQPNPLLLGADGNLYGTTTYGGSNTTIVDSNQDVGYGTFFQLTTNGIFTLLYSFGSVTNAEGVPLDGANPSGPLVQGLDGNFFGVTQFGGASNTGTMFRITPQGALTSLFACRTNARPSFGAPLLDPLATGTYPRGGLMLASDGSFYGTTYDGGTESDDHGAIFRLGPAVPRFSNAPVNLTIPAGATNNYSAEAFSIYENSFQWQFDGTNLVDGGTFSGSATTNLTISAATLADAGTYTLIASNVAGTNAVSAVLTIVPALILSQPVGATIIAGGSNTFSAGVDSILPASFQWQFDGTNLSDGGNISGSATTDLTVSGATLADAGTYSLIISNSAGTVQSEGAVLVVEPFFVSSPPASLTLLAGASGTFTVDIASDLPMSYQWQLNGTNLSDGLDFSGSETSNLTVTATLADAGTYTVAATNAAGSMNFSVFLTVITPFARGTTLSNIYSFNGGDGGAYPMAALLQASDGNFYGTTTGGGAYGDGVVFRVSATGSSATLYSFGANTNGLDGAGSVAALVAGNDTNFYGTTEFGGLYGYGTVFAVTTAGNLTTLDAFTGNYGLPVGALALDTNGYFYGGTLLGDFFQMGVGGTLTNIFDTPVDATGCSSTLLIGADGNLYGASKDGGTNGDGYIFSLTTNGAFATLYSFTGGVDGANPGGPLIQGGDGAFYGTTTSHGANGFGTIFKLTTNGTLSVLYSFGSVTNWDGSAQDGAQANGLLLGNDGNFYGTTASGGYNGDGTVFRLTPKGELTTLAFFDGTNGANPEAALVLGNDGHYYGTTANGGSNNAGMVFKLAVPPGLTAISQSNGMISFSSSALVGQNYQVQFASSLAPSNWQNLGAPIPATSPIITFTNAIGANQSFYRVVQFPSQ
jgi:uncharacterized repeat protein (TIGR03803 family)